MFFSTSFYTNPQKRYSVFWTPGLASKAGPRGWPSCALVEITNIDETWDYNLLQKTAQIFTNDFRSALERAFRPAPRFFFPTFFQGWSVQKVAPRKATQRGGTREDWKKERLILAVPRWTYAPHGLWNKPPVKETLFDQSRTTESGMLRAYTLQDSRQVWERICVCLSAQVVGVLSSISANRFLHVDPSIEIKDDQGPSRLQDKLVLFYYVLP